MSEDKVIDKVARGRVEGPVAVRGRPARRGGWLDKVGDKVLDQVLDKVPWVPRRGGTTFACEMHRASGPGTFAGC